jgi:hypothetical protein
MAEANVRRRGIGRADCTLPGHPWARQLTRGKGPLRLPDAEPAAVRAAVVRSAEVSLPRGLRPLQHLGDSAASSPGSTRNGATPDAGTAPFLPAASNR